MISPEWPSCEGSHDLHVLEPAAYDAHGLFRREML
jgi:hypothetical protein